MELVSMQGIHRGSAEDTGQERSGTRVWFCINGLSELCQVKPRGQNFGTSVLAIGCTLPRVERQRWRGNTTSLSISRQQLMAAQGVKGNNSEPLVDNTYCL